MVLVDPEPWEAIDVVENLNVHLLELRYFDALLERRLADSYALTGAKARRLPLWNAGLQRTIDDVYPVSLYGQYTGFKDVTLSLGVNNVFDQDPAHYHGTTQLTNGYVGGNLGRVVYLGATKKF